MNIGLHHGAFIMAPGERNRMTAPLKESMHETQLKGRTGLAKKICT